MKIPLTSGLLLNEIANIMQTAIEVMNPINKAMQNITNAHECFSPEFKPEKKISGEERT
jgi:hypothetical protein